MTKTILLADDSVTIQKVIELTFMDQDHRVETVGSGDAAIARLADFKPDFVITDVHMPGADGYEVARRSKALHPDVPVLLLVGTFEPFDEGDFASSGADQVLKKPFDSQELIRLVAEMSPGSAPTEATAAAAPTAAEPFAGLDDLGVSAPAAAPSAELDPFDFGSPVPKETGLNEAVASEAEPANEPAVEDDTGDAAEATDARTEESSGVEAVVTEIAVEEDATPAAFSLAWEDDEDDSSDDDSEDGDSEDDDSEDDDSDEDSEDDDSEDRDSEDRDSEDGDSEDDLEVDPSAEEDAEESHEPTGRILSDDDIERIARRVADLVGEKLVRQVAWDVIPDMAEVVIRERLQELESQVE